MKQIFDQSLLNQLNQIFSQEKEVLAVYAFGSRVNSYEAKKSDLDLAVFVKDKSRLSERDILKLLLKKELKIPYEIDLTVVDFTSPPLLLFQIIKTGASIYQKSASQKVNLEAKAMLFYYDNEHMRNIYAAYLDKSLKEGTYGYK